MRLISVFMVAFLAPYLLLPAVADEEGVAILALSQHDANNDGLVDVTVIDCTFATEHDRIYVVDQAGDMARSTDWQTMTDFDDDVWLYDIGADGSVQLIAVYRTEHGHEMALVYDDQDGDGQVSYEQNGTKITITESPHWSARIKSASTWYLPDGSLNLNVQVELDGPMLGFDRMPDDYRLGTMRHDGLVDVVFEEVADADGTARYALSRLVAPSPSSMSFRRTGLWSNDGRYESKPYARAFFPFLPVAFTGGEIAQMNLRWFDLSAHVSVDWLSGKVQGVGLAGNTIGHGYFCNDDEYLEKGQVNDVSFECPLANYDLADNHDAFPELNIRMFTYPPGDQRLQYWTGDSGTPLQEIYYSWNQFNPGTLSWDYKLGLSGNHTIDAVEEFPDFSLRKVPFDEFPVWIAGQTWKLTTFVARENRAYVSTEGIWEWNPLAGPDPVSRGDLSPSVRSTGLAYMLGLDTTSPDKHFTWVNAGFRAERSFTGPAKPRLYFSPIDRKLHLLGAQWGTWNVDDNANVQYADRDGDGYVDEWQYVEAEEVRRQLNVFADHLVYAGDGRVVIERTSVSPALFESKPPGKHEEWVALGEQLERYRLDFAPGDLVGMLQQFGGLGVEIQGATLRDLRKTSQGFRFLLWLQPGFTILSDPERWRAKLTAPCTYAITFDGKGWEVRPATLAALRAGELTVVDQGQPLRALNWTSIEVLLENKGLEDVYALPAYAVLIGPEGDQRVLTTTVELLPGESSQQVTWDWLPPAAGVWQARIEVGRESELDADSARQILLTTDLHVEPWPVLTDKWFLSLGGQSLPTMLALLAGVAALASSSMALWVVGRGLERR